jgi:hypothetical protein
VVACTQSNGRIAVTNADRIRSVHAERCGDPRHRYRSWEHCYAHFQEVANRRTDEKPLQLAYLHLGFYLASWGMYRGSSFLLQKDYLVHEPAIRCLFTTRHQSLWSCDDRILKGDDGVANEVFALAGEVRDAYLAEFRNSHDGRRDKSAEDISSTLVTKVLLGTMGCSPAYDRYFLNGARGTIKPLRFGVDSLKSVIGFVRDNRKELFDVQRKLAKDGVRYPLMKLVDMCFWQKGYEIAESEEARTKGGKEKA